ncbi:N-acetyltransferase ESCO2 [Polypterus senegalus]
MSSLVTPRKRKRNFVESESYMEGNPTKKLLKDFAFPHRKKKSASIRKKASKLSHAEKENYPSLCQMALPDYPISSYAHSVLTSSNLYKFPSAGSDKDDLKESVNTSSFYSKKSKQYLTPLDRKHLNKTKSMSSGEGVEESRIPNANKPNKTKKAKRTSNRVSQGLKSQKPKCYKLSCPVQQKNILEQDTSKQYLPPGNNQNEVQLKTFSKLTFSGLSAKPKPKLLVGAAFFATGKNARFMYKKPVQKTFKPNLGNNKNAEKSNLNQSFSYLRNNENEQQQNQQLQFLQKQKERLDVKAENGAKKGHLDCVTKNIKNHEISGQNVVDKSSLSDEHVQHGKTLQLEKESDVLSKCSVTQQLRIVLKKLDEECLSSSRKESEIKDNEGIMTRESDIEFHKVSPQAASVYPIFSTPSSVQKRKCQPGILASPVLNSTTPFPKSSLLKPVKQTKAKKKKDGELEPSDQLVIDAGQKNFGATMCSSCGMVYTTGSTEDELQHTQYHQSILDRIKFVGWKKERVVAQYWDGKIIQVLPDDPKYAVKKADEIRTLADEELGFKQATLSCPSKSMTYLFVSNEKTIIGCLVAEQIRQAFRVLNQPADANGSKANDIQEPLRAWCCSTKPVNAICGISRIWVFGLMRRKGIATRMVNTLRNTFIYGCQLSTEEIAFSDPTPDGKLFATKYCETPEFLVYNFLS